jgi:hypothetical protein
LKRLTNVEALEMLRAGVLESLHEDEPAIADELEFERLLDRATGAGTIDELLAFYQEYADLEDEDVTNFVIGCLVDEEPTQ